MPPEESKNINDDFFDGFYKEIWRNLIPEGLTKAEVGFLIESANLKAGSKVLDLMCGYGRHALALARNGIEVTAVDNLPAYVCEIQAIAENEKLPIVILQQNVLDLRPSQKFDLSICLGNNMCFFPLLECLKLLSTAADSLKAKGLFIFNSWMIAEIVMKSFQEKSWESAGDFKCLYRSKFLFSPSRVETEAIFIRPDGTTEVKTAIDYVYSLNEVEAMLTEVGLELKDIWSIPNKKKFVLGDPRVYVVCEKR